MPVQREQSPSARRLPRGRHDLTRQQVEDDQRLRILIGVADAMADAGYVSTPVAAILRASGVSRETFYRFYDDKLAAFLAAFDLVSEVLLLELATTIAEQGAPLDRVERGLSRYLRSIADHRPYARLFLVESYAAGPEAIVRKQGVQQRIADELATILGARSAGGRFACLAVVSSVGSMIVPPLLADDEDGIMELHDLVLDHVRRLHDGGVFGP